MSTIHGKYGTPAYRSWQGMHARCHDINKAKWYSDRGIKICERWQKFENFFEDMGERPEGMTLDRIDGNKGYEPGNCRWATRKEQSGNQRSNIILEFHGRSQCVSWWAQEVGVQRQTILQRLRKGWPIEKVLSTQMYKRITKTLKAA